MSVESEVGQDPKHPLEIKSEPEMAAAAAADAAKIELEPLPQPSFALDEESRGSYQEEIGPGPEDLFQVGEGAPCGSQEDDLSLFMRSMAQTMRRLPPRQRAVLKYQIHALVHKAEMEFYNDWSLP